jgi:hypothetical protein
MIKIIVGVIAGVVIGSFFGDMGPILLGALGGYIGYKIDTSNSANNKGSGNFRVLNVTDADYADCRLAADAFDGANGSIYPGMATPDHVTGGEKLWLTMPCSKSTLEIIWQESGISTSETSSYNEVMSCEDTIYYIDVVKAKVGFSPVIWIGNVTV